MTQQSQAARLVAQIIELEHERSNLLQKELAPSGAWIHSYSINRRFEDGTIATYTYAKWQSLQPIFKSKKDPKTMVRHQHIGRIESSTGLGMTEATEAAFDAFNRTLRVKAIDEAMNTIQSTLQQLDGLKSIL